MCEEMKGHCFSDVEKIKLSRLGWKDDEIEYVEGSIVEDNIKELIKQ